MRFLIAALVCGSSLVGNTEEAAPQPAFNPEQPVARIGDDVITAGEFQRDLAYRWMVELKNRGINVNATAIPEPPAEFRRLALEELVNGNLVRVLAENENITVTDEEVEQEYLRARLLDQEGRIKEFLEKESLTEAELREQLRKKLRMNKYLDAIKSITTVTPEELKAEYERLAKQGTLKRPRVTFDVEHVFIGVDADTPEAWNAALVEAERARQRIIAGETFAVVAKEMSDDAQSVELGGMYYEAQPGQVPKAVSDQIVKLAVGQLSEPFKSELGYHVIRIARENKPGEVAPLESMQDRIKHVLLAKRATETLRERIKNARNVIAIEIYTAVADVTPMNKPAEQN